MSFLRFSQQVARRQFHTTRIFRAGGGKEFKFPLAVRTESANKQSKLTQWFYKTFLQKTSTYFALMGVLAWTFDYGLDYVIDGYSAKVNKGRSFEDVIATFPEIPPNCGQDEDEEDEE